jgi:YidC/Oxa1 family membrane protein insertase
VRRDKVRHESLCTDSLDFKSFIIRRSTRRYYIAFTPTQLRSSQVGSPRRRLDRWLSTSRPQRLGLSLPCHSLRAQAPSLATRNIWFFSKKAEMAPPPTAPEPVSTPEAAASASAPAASSPATPTAEAAIPADAGVAQLEAASSLPVPDAVDTTSLAALVPLQYGDLAALGLAGWSPAGLSSWMLELVNVSTGLPWFHTIVAGTLVSRLLLLPFSLKQLRNSAALAPHQPRLLELKQELDRAYRSGDKIAVQRVALKQRRVYAETGVSMLPMLLLPFVQLPVTLGMFFGVKRLCALPLEQLHHSGVSFLPDLTIPDPYYILPITSAVLMNLQLSVRIVPPCRGMNSLPLPPF